MKTLKNLSKESLRRKLHDIHQAKGYKSFGDVLLNFFYSYHLYLTRGKIEGYKVTNKELSRVYDMFLKSFFSRVDKHDKGDIIEALIAYCFLNNKISFEEIISACKKEKFLESIVKICLERLENHEF